MVGIFDLPDCSQADIKTCLQWVNLFFVLSKLSLIVLLEAENGLNAAYT